MTWNGWVVIDLDSHIQERPATMYGDYIDPEFRAAFQRLKQALDNNFERGLPAAIASSRHAVVAPVVSDGTLGIADSFGNVPRDAVLNKTAGDGRRNFGRPDQPDLPRIRPEVSWDVAARLEDMDASFIDIDVLFPTHVSSYSAITDVRFESALYRAYHRWVHDFSAQAPDRLKWTVVASMRDPVAAREEITYWAEQDPNMVGIYLPPNGPNNQLLDDPNLHPIYATVPAGHI
jgi:predicted TIM-barrel fold metal-dependent hydrolase